MIFLDGEILLEDIIDTPVDTTTTIDTVTDPTTIDSIKELLIWILGTNLIMIACLLIIAFFVGKASA